MGNERARISEREMTRVTIINGGRMNTLSAPKIASSSLLAAWGHPQTNKTSFLTRSQVSTSVLHSMGMQAHTFISSELRQKQELGLHGWGIKLMEGRILGSCMSYSRVLGCTHCAVAPLQNNIIITKGWSLYRHVRLFHVLYR